MSSYGLPRSRGDRPWYYRAVGNQPTAPPLTRGSTIAGIAWWNALTGSPAHAGIDPRCTVSRPGFTRLPRSRGDRPAGIVFSATSLRAPPLTRGSTPRHPGKGRARAGSPAHAGIDPETKAARSGASRLPRSRGDRPDQRTLGEIVAAAPPLTRGSTCAISLLLSGGTGSPAHAGIDPARFLAMAAHRPSQGRRADPNQPPLTQAQSYLLPGNYLLALVT